MHIGLRARTLSQCRMGNSGQGALLNLTYGKKLQGLVCRGLFRYLAVLLLVLATARPTHAQQTLSWSPTGTVDSGGSGTWNTIGAVWANAAVCCQPWNNAAIPAYDALFTGAAGTVTVSGTIGVHSITFNTGGYTLTGGTLTLQGLTPTISSTGALSTIRSVVGGSAGMVKGGTGTILLTGANTYSGTTTISDGTLQVGSGGTTGTLGTGAVVNNAGLTFSRSNTLTVGNGISGTGTVTKTGSGTTIFTGANSYSGTTTISTGTLQVGNGGTTGTLGTGAVVNNATVTFNRSDGVTVGNPMTGTGRIVKMGTGTTILTGANSYGGTTTISAGTLQVGNGGTTGTLGIGAVAVANTGTLSFNRSDAVTVGNVISGAGRVIQMGPGTTTFVAANTYSGTTTISAGVLQVGSGGTTGTLGTGAVVNNGGLTFNRSNTVTVANAISGTGTVTKAGTGTTIFTGANTYSGTTTISTGTLQVGSGGTTGTLGTGAVVNNAGLTFSRSNTLTVGNSISGTGTVTKTGSGTTIFTGANSYSGTTTISTGTLQVGQRRHDRHVGHRGGGQQCHGDVQPQRWGDGGQPDDRHRPDREGGHGDHDSHRGQHAIAGRRRSAPARCRSGTAARPGRSGSGRWRWPTPAR